MRRRMLRAHVDHQVPLFRRAYFFDHVISFDPVNFVAAPLERRLGYARL
jgi:hypothetical protein